MTETSSCPSCGERIGAHARVCASCRVRRDGVELAHDPAGRPPQPLAGPAAVAALLAGASAAGVVLLAGLLIALIAPDASIVGSVGADASLLTEAFRQAAGTLLAPLVEPNQYLLAGSRRIHPMILLAIPLTALALATRRQLHRTRGAPTPARLGWALLVALPFGLLALVIAALGGETPSTRVSVSAGNTLALGILWGLLGGALGAASALPVRRLVTAAPAVRRGLEALTATLRPLAAVLLASTAIALVGWLVQVATDAGGVRAGRSTATALIEEAVYGAEHGVHLAALAAGALFRPDWTGAIGLPFPVENPNELPGADGGLRIFSYEGTLPAYVVVPALIALVSLVALGALYAGFAAARAVGADRPAPAAAWGALTGPAWAAAMAILVVLAGGLYHGDAADGSVLAVFLVGGGALGAAGGALSAVGASARRDREAQAQPVRGAGHS